MDSPTHATRVINGTSCQDGVDILLNELGFTDPPHSLDEAARDRMQLPAFVSSARVSVGEGVLRALAVRIASTATVRDAITPIARQLSAHAPHLLWLLVVTQSESATIGIAAWRVVRSTPRIAVMITERERVIDSDAETLCALAAARHTPGDTMRQLRWLDILGRDALTRRFFRSLTAAIDTLAGSLPATVPPADAREIALLAASRLVFLSFLETRGWLNNDFGFLANGFGDCMMQGGRYQLRVLEPLFFGTLNTRVSKRAPRAMAFGRIPFLNGGLFTRTAVERVHGHARFSDDALGGLFGDVLVRYRFTAREDGATWSQSAIDPEMLGKVFESVMGSADRKRKGVFYTPQHFVERVTTLALHTMLERRGVSHTRAMRLLGDEPAAPASLPDPKLLGIVAQLRVLDPACGSGAFLVHMLERLARIRMALGDPASESDIRRSVLTHSIFGVDSNPTAVWLCELRLWLSAVIDTDESDPMRIVPLPNLDRQIRVGDSLSGDVFARDDGRTNPITSPGATGVLRARYVRATGSRKISLGKRLDAEERARAIASIDAALAISASRRREIVRAARDRDLFDSRHPPNPRQRERLAGLRVTTRALRHERAAILRGAAPAFTYPVHFADVAGTGGFDVIVGNPPWVRLCNISTRDRARYRDRFDTFRASAWANGARVADAGRGFAGQVDLAALFVERSVGLLAPDGTLGMLLPSKLWRSLAGGGARQLLLSRTRIAALEDHSEGPGTFDAAVYPSILVITGNYPMANEKPGTVRAGSYRCGALGYWETPQHDLAFDASAGSPWLLLPPRVRASFNCLTDAGVPLFATPLGRPRLGVKTGCNEAFVMTGGNVGQDIIGVTGTAHHDNIETHMLRPVVRGETLTAWRLTRNDERIIWTHDGNGSPLPKLPPHTYRWLARYRRSLERRSDSHSSRWWSLFRVEAARADSPRVVWSDFGRMPRAAVLDAGDRTVPLNTCYSIACPDIDDALALAAILNSHVAASWLACIAEPARGGYHRYLGWTVARLPIPRNWPRARQLLSPVAELARRGNEPAAAALTALVLDAYELDARAIAPLLYWNTTHAGD